MNRTPMIMFAPDAGAAGGETPAVQTPLVVPEIPSNANAGAVENVEVPVSPGVIRAAEELDLAIPGVIGPKEALGDDGVAEMERMQEEMVGQKEGRARGPDGKFLPKEKKPDAQATPPPAKKDDKAAKPPVPAPKAAEKPPVKPPVAAAPVKPEQKVKVGEKEMTQAELEAYVKDLQTKAGQVPKPQAVEAPAAKKPEEIAAEQQAAAAKQKEQDDKFITDVSKEFTPTEQELDVMLAGGPKAVEAYAQDRAKLALWLLKRVSSQVNRITRNIEQDMTPLIQRDQQIREYQRDHAFLDANPDIKANDKGLETSHNIRKELNDHYSLLQQKIAQNTATPEEKVWAMSFEVRKPEDFENDIAHHTRERLKITPAAAKLAVAPVVPPKPPVKPAVQAKPFSGERPGGAAPARKQETADERALREMDEHQGLTR